MCVCVALLFNSGLFWVGSGVVCCKAINIINSNIVNATVNKNRRGTQGTRGGVYVYVCNGNIFLLKLDY